MLNSSELFRYNPGLILLCLYKPANQALYLYKVFPFQKCLKLMRLEPLLTARHNCQLLLCKIYQPRQEVFQHHFKIPSLLTKLNLSKYPCSMHTVGWKTLSYNKKTQVRKITPGRGSNIKTGYRFFNSSTEHIAALKACCFT